jgi:undecaprenyl-diphosphatase
VSGLLTLVLRQILKELFHRHRPELWATISENSYSFPSGHALGSVIIYGVLVYGMVQARPRWSPILWGSYGMLVAVIGFSRLYLGLHWPTDVLGGWVFGAMALLGLIRGQEGLLTWFVRLGDKVRRWIGQPPKP